DWLQDEDVHRILDHPVRVAGSKLDVGDHPVAPVVRVELAARSASQLLVLPDRAEAQAAERGRLAGKDGRRLRARRIPGDADDPRFDQGWGNGQYGENRECDGSHGLSPHGQRRRAVAAASTNAADPWDGCVAHKRKVKGWRVSRA